MLFDVVRVFSCCSDVIRRLSDAAQRFLDVVRRSSNVFRCCHRRCQILPDTFFRRGVSGVHMLLGVLKVAIDRCYRFSRVSPNVLRCVRCCPVMSDVPQGLSGDFGRFVCWWGFCRKRKNQTVDFEDD